MFVIDVCAGAGGLSLGWKRQGATVLGVERDEDACSTHRAMVGPCELADITTWMPPKGRRVGVVGGGVPCQPYSAAGARKGLETEDGRLYTHLLRIASAAKAEVCLLENVRGMLTWKHPATGERTVTIIERAFREHGFEPVTGVLNAADYGVPQHRHRLFIVGFRSQEARVRFRWPSPSHAAPGHPTLPPWRTVWQALRLGDGAFDVGLMPGATGWQGQRFMNVDSPAYSLGTKGNGDLIAALAEAQLLDRPATTVQGDPRLSVAGHHTRQQKGAVRLQPEDCAKLQSFPDDFVFSGSRSSKYRQTGNAVPPLLAEALAHSVLLALSPKGPRP